MENSGDVKFESFNAYPWLDYQKYKDTWLPVMGAGSNGQDKFCILTQIDDTIQRAIVTKEIFEMIIAHEGHVQFVGSRWQWLRDTRGRLDSKIR